MTSASSLRLSVARCMIFVSTVCLLTMRNTSTGRVCPMRCARSCACRSICGFCGAVSISAARYQRASAGLTQSWS